MSRGAIAVVVRDTAASGDGENALVVMGPSAQGVKIPSVFVSRRTGEDLEILLGGATPVRVELFAADDVSLYLAGLPELFMSVMFIAFSFSLGVMCCHMRSRHAFRRYETTTPILVVNTQGMLEPLMQSAPEPAKPAPRPVVPLPYPVVGGSTRVAMLSQDPNSPGEPITEKGQQEL